MEAREVTETIPDCVTTDVHHCYPGAIEKDVLHRTNRYLNNLIE